MTTQTQVRELMGMGVSDTNGTKVGTIKQVYLNDDSGAPEWITVHTGWFGMRESFVPLTGSRKDADMLQVPYDKETIKGAPNVDADEHLSHAQIVDLYRHYGVRPPDSGPSMGEAGEGRRTTAAEGGTETRGGTAGPAGTAGAAGMAVRPDRAGRGTAGQTRPDTRTMPEQQARGEAESPMTEITRSEEQIHIGTERVESGRVRVRKWIETETVERTVPCTHDEIKIDREKISNVEPGTRVTITEDDKEIVLYEDRPIVTKEAVPVERVRVRTEQVQDEQTVRSDLRKERVEVSRDDETGRARGERAEAGGRHTGGGRKT